MQVFREAKPRRIRRQLATMTNAVRAGRSRAKNHDPRQTVDSDALLRLIKPACDDVELVRVPVNRRPWTSTTVHVQSGDQITWLAWGHVDLIKPLGSCVGPSIGLLCRVRDGKTRESGRATMSFTADRIGPVEVACRLPGWLLEDGSITADHVPHRLPYSAMSGDLAAILIRWAPGTDPRAALAMVASEDESGLCRAEIERLSDPPGWPPGWQPHPSAAREEIWAPTDNGVSVNCRDSGGIIRHPADIRLTPTLELRWSWRVAELPSRLPEDTKISHDYLSIALEFDDGRDLTWQWSSALPEGFAYPCPFDFWRKLETHIVVRAGSRDLGQWIDEVRPVLSDHQSAIGGDAPARVVNVWLIAVSYLQGGAARAEFRDIELVDGDTVLRIGQIE